MDQLLLISIVTGAALGILALGIGTVVVRLYSDRLARGIDLDLYYQAIDDPKRRVNPESEVPAPDTANPLPTLSIWYGIGVGAAMCLVTRVLLALSLDLADAMLAVLITWLLVASLPLLATLSHHAKQIVVLDIASILERVAQSQKENGEVWAISCSKIVAGGDLFGKDEEDRLNLLISRTEVAPVTLGLSGCVEVAEAGLQRTVKKSGLRQLRIQGWEVNELRETEAEVAYHWSLHDHTYADIARSLAWTVEALGFPLRKVQLRKAQLHEKENHAD